MGHFKSYLVTLFQNKSSCKTFHMIEFDWYETEPTGGLHFHMSDFTQRLILKQRQQATQKWQWPINHKYLLSKYFYSKACLLFHNHAYQGFLTAKCTCMIEILNIYE